MIPVQKPVNSPPSQKLVRHKATISKFHVPSEIIPKGTSYEWKRLTTLGQEDRQHQLSLRRNHWAPVPARRHKEMFGDIEGPAIIDGLMLMERPEYLTQEARMEDTTNAVSQINNQMARLDQIPGIGKDFEQVPSKVERVYERNEVPDDEPVKAS